MFTSHPIIKVVKFFGLTAKIQLTIEELSFLSLERFTQGGFRLHNHKRAAKRTTFKKKNRFKITLDCVNTVKYRNYSVNCRAHRDTKLKVAYCPGISIKHPQLR